MLSQEKLQAGIKELESEGLVYNKDFTDETVEELFGDGSGEEGGDINE